MDDYDNGEQKFERTDPEPEERDESLTEPDGREERIFDDADDSKV
jgi:hypothetical protein